MDPDYQLQRDLFDDKEIKLVDQLRTMNKSHGNEWTVGRDDEIRLNSINIFLKRKARELIDLPDIRADGVNYVKNHPTFHKLNNERVKKIKLLG